MACPGGAIRKEVFMTGAIGAAPSINATDKAFLDKMRDADRSVSDYHSIYNEIQNKYHWRNVPKYQTKRLEEAKAKISTSGNEAMQYGKEHGYLKKKSVKESSGMMSIEKNIKPKAKKLLLDSTLGLRWDLSLGKD